MAVTKAAEAGESSKSAALGQLKANANGAANYELPWYANHVLSISLKI